MVEEHKKATEAQLEQIQKKKIPCYSEVVSVGGCNGQTRTSLYHILTLFSISNGWLVKLINTLLKGAVREYPLNFN